MFHLKILNKTTHPDLDAIKATVTKHPKRKFTTELHGYNFPETKVKELLQSDCGVCLSTKDNYSDKSIQDFITVGNKNVVLLPKDFAEDKFLAFLEKGASTVVGLNDGFDVFQITKMVDKGKEKTFVKGEQLLEDHIKGYLEKGGSVLLKKGDLTPFAITRLLDIGKDRIHINTAGFTNLRITRFLEGKAIVTFGSGNQLSQNRIKQKVEQFKSQVRIESEHFKFDQDWIKEMEGLGAVIL